MNRNKRSIFGLLIFCLAVCAEQAWTAHRYGVKDRQQIMMLGNSLTEGEDPDGYVNMTRILLKHAAPEMTLYVGNAGKGGNTCVDMLDRLDRDVLRFRPDWVTVSAGINDVNRGFTADHPDGDAPQGISLDQYRTTVTTLVRRVKKQGARVALFTPTVIKENLSSKENARLAPFRAAIREIAQREQCLLVDMGAAFLEALQPLQKPEMPLSGVLTADGVHLLPAGSWLMAKTLVLAWGVAAHRIDAAKEAVMQEVEQQKATLQLRMHRYETANQIAGPPLAGETRVVLIGSGAVEQWQPAPVSPCTLLNRGIAGETSRSLRMRFHQDVVTLKPAAVLLWPGFCDDLQSEQRMSIVDTESHLARIARLAQGSGIRLAMGSVLPAANAAAAAGHNRKVAALNTFIKKLCRENGYLYVDFAQVLSDHQGRIQSRYGRNGTDLEPEAYTSLQPMLEQAVTELLKPAESSTP